MHRWQEWLISACLITLSLAAVWTVFGDDLAQLISPAPPGPSPSSSVESATKGPPPRR